MKDNKLGGIKSAAESIRGLERKEQVNLLAKIALEDSKLAEEIKKHLFQFEDLKGLSPNDFNKVQQWVEAKKLFCALRNVSEEFKEDLSKILSKRAYERLWEEVENIGPQRLSEVKKCQQEIIDLVHEKANQGAIALPNKWSSEDYVA